MVMRDKGSFHCPEPKGAVEGYKHGQGRGDGHCLYPKITILNCFIVPIQCLYTRLFALVEL